MSTTTEVVTRDDMIELLTASEPVDIVAELAARLDITEQDVEAVIA